MVAEMVAREASGACYKPRDTLGTGRLSSHRWCSPDRAGQTNRTCTLRARSSANSDRRKTVVVVMVVAALPVVVVVMVVAVGMPVAMAAVVMAAEDTVARAVPVAAVGRRAATAAASAATSGPEAWCKQEKSPRQGSALELTDSLQSDILVQAVLRRLCCRPSRAGRAQSR